MLSTPVPPAAPLAANDDSIGTLTAAAAPPAQPDPVPWISFGGGPNESAASFIQSVQRIAFLQNRIEDDKWMAQYASTCFTDLALEWYFGIEEGVRSSWAKMRVALIQRYPFQVAAQPINLPAHTATSVPLPPNATSSAAISTNAKSTGIGIIEVLRPEFGDILGYISRDSAGKFVVDPSPEKAVKLQKVLHTDSNVQNKRIYSLKLMNEAPDSQFPFLGLQLIKFPEDDPDTIPSTSSGTTSWKWIRHAPSCCNISKDFAAKLAERSGLTWLPEEETMPYEAWDLVQASESALGPFYIRKAQGRDQKARVVSAVWTIADPVKDVEELGLTWPWGSKRHAGSITELQLDPVVYKGGFAGLHVHRYGFVSESLPSRNLDESHVVLVFKEISRS